MLLASHVIRSVFCLYGFNGILEFIVYKYLILKLTSSSIGYDVQVCCV